MGSPLHSALLDAGVRSLGAIAASHREPGPGQSRKLHRPTARLATLAAIAALALQPAAAPAHETDQSTLPLGREFADLKVPLSEMVRGALAEAVSQTNLAIKRSLWRGEPTERTAPLQTADWIAGQVWVQMFAAFPTTEGLDIALAGEVMRARYPGLVTVYRPEQLIYDDPVLLLDVTKLTRTFFRASTINVDGTLFGTDKIIHFIHLGRIYHSSYLAARQRGMSEAEAVAGAVKLSTGSNVFLSEKGFLGIVSTGVRSNGDLAANFLGFKFYRNLTETVRIGDRVLPPMLVREGLYWQLAERVRIQPDFFAAFVTPHFNEALNANSYAIVTDSRVRKMVRTRCADILARYRDERGNPQDRAQFARIEQDLSTLYGEDYGWRSDGKDRVSIATTCFPEEQATGARSLVTAKGSAPALGAAATQPAAPHAAAPGRSNAARMDRFGRSRLWWAARDGRRVEVEELLTAGEDPNGADIDGETPLHAAARWGHAAIVETLLARGADPAATALYGMTPLHVAVEESRLEASQVLLEFGSNANARDMFGASPLHQAAAHGNQRLASLLLRYGADPWAADDGAMTPLQLAERSGNRELAKVLSSHGVNATVRHAGGSPAQEQGTVPDAGALLQVSTGAGATRPEEPAAVPDAAAGSSGQ
jgi:hypothetical protein